MIISSIMRPHILDLMTGRLIRTVFLRFFYEYFHAYWHQFQMFTQLWRGQFASKHSLEFSQLFDRLLRVRRTVYSRRICSFMGKILFSKALKWPWENIVLVFIPKKIKIQCSSGNRSPHLTSMVITQMKGTIQVSVFCCALVDNSNDKELIYEWPPLPFFIDPCWLGYLECFSFFHFFVSENLLQAEKDNTLLSVRVRLRCQDPRWRDYSGTLF